MLILLLNVPNKNNKKMKNETLQKFQLKITKMQSMISWTVCSSKRISNSKYTSIKKHSVLFSTLTTNQLLNVWPKTIFCYNRHPRQDGHIHSANVARLTDVVTEKQAKSMGVVVYTLLARQKWWICTFFNFAKRCFCPDWRLKACLPFVQCLPLRDWFLPCLLHSDNSFAF